MVGRFVLLGGLLTVGEPGRRAAAAGDGARRPHRSFRRHAQDSGGRAMTSPLTSVALFHLGPVPITAGVVATWAIMAVLVLGGILITRRLSLVPVGKPGGLRADRRYRGQPDPRYDAGRARSLSRLHRHAVRLHLRRQLVVAGAGRRTADGPSRDRRRARAPGLPRGDLVRHSCGRRARLSRAPSPRPTRS